MDRGDGDTGIRGARDGVKGAGDGVKGRGAGKEGAGTGEDGAGVGKFWGRGLYMYTLYIKKHACMILIPLQPTFI